MAWPSPFLPLLEHDPSTNITKDEGSWIATIYLIAGPFGAILASVVIDRIGRKMSLLLSALPYLASWTIIASTQRIGFLLSARFIGGMAEGVIYTVLPVYIGELAEPQIRGLLISLIAVLTMVAALLINVLGYYLNITYSSIICSVPHLLFLLSFPFLPETPNHYIVKGELDKARDALGQVRGRAVDDEEIEELVRINGEGLAKANILDLFRIASNRKGLFVFMGTMAAQQFTGIVPIMFYTQTIFEEAASDFPVIVSTVLLYVGLIVFSILSAVIVDRVGRRPLIITSIVCCGLALLAEGVNLYIKHKGGVDGVGFSWVTIGDFSFLIISYSIGLMTLPTVFAGELFPLNVKAAAICFCNIYFAVIATGIAKLFQFANDEYGLYVPFFVFAICLFLSLVYVVLFVPETKNKTLEQIQIELKAVKANTESITKL